MLVYSTVITITGHGFPVLDKGRGELGGKDGKGKKKKLEEKIVLPA